MALKQAAGKVMKVALLARIPANEVTCRKSGCKAHALSGKAVRAIDFLVFMINRTFRACYFLAAITFLSLAANEALAQAIDQTAMVITASRFESSPQDASIAAQIITADEIRDSSANTIAEVLGKLGGVHTRINFTGVPDSSVDLRGFGMTGDQNTLVLVNGQRLSENEGISARLSSIPLNSIKRIEILRGAGAVLYGGGATGGTINILTSAPLEDGMAGAGSVSMGSYNLLDLRASIQAKNGDWGISLNGQKYKTDNYRYGNHAELESLGGEIRYGDAVNFVALRFGVDDQNSNLPGVRKINLVTGVDQFLTDPRGITTPGDYLNSKTNHFSMHGEKRLDDVVVAFDVGRRNKERSSFGTYEGNSGSTVTQANTRISMVSPRLLWTTPVYGLKNLLTLGADWSFWSYDGHAVGTGTAPSLADTGEQKNQAFYFRDELFLTKKTRVSFGIRDEKVQQDNNYAGNDSWGTSSTSNRSTKQGVSAHELAFQQNLDAGYSLYGRTGRSFRVANIDENRCDLYATPCAPMLKPQTSRDQEVGAQWQVDASSFRVSVFKMNITDEIHYNPITSGNVNLSPTQHSGFELEGKISLSKTLVVGGRYKRIKARFTDGVYSGYESNDYSYSPFTVSVAGKDVPLVPKHSLSASLNWKMSAATRLTLFGNYVGGQRYDNDQANQFREMPSYLTVDIKMLHFIGAWRLSAGINNLFDKAYYSYGVTNVSGGIPVRYNVYPEARRNGYVGAEYRF